jgi:predicted glutamine amidotransferase
MCIIFYNERGEKYQERELRNAFRTNDDGIGLMWVQDGKVETFHGMLTEERLVGMMKEFEGIPHALHLRFATHGKPCVELCHPFKVTPEGADQSVWMMHNGVITECGARAETHESDTLVFARDRAQDIAELGNSSSDLFFDDAYIGYMEKIISGDRMIFLRDDGSVSILTPNAWHVDKETGIWYSNRYSVADRPRYSSYGWMRENWTGSPLMSASKASTKAEDAEEAESKASYPGGGSYVGAPSKSAEESAKILLAANPVTSERKGSAVDIDEDEDDESLFFKWEGDEFVPCAEAEADIEVDADEYYDHWAGDDDEDDEIEWD